MRAGLSTIQQTLTPEAASILNHSISEARKRNHGQTTPLHVAATLLASPSGYLRQACIRSHPNSSHPLQSRALELCFSVALERLPSAQGLGPGSEPPISNALMAALKRAQAHQRRGCPEQQQQPLLAVKVELEQLIVSILDDPSVSRVMREASFSSPAVKAIIEQSLNSSQVSSISLASSGLGFRLGNPQSILRTLSRTQTKHFENGIGRDDAGSRPLVTPNRNLYLNPRLQVAAAGSCDQSGQRREEVKKVIDILSRRKKRNPVLVGDTEPDAVVRELLLRIEKKEVVEGFKTAQVVSVEKELASVCVEDGDKAQIAMKFNELGSLVKSRISGGIILNLGNLKWLVEQPVAKAGTSEFGISSPGPVQQAISEVGQLVVAEMGRLLDRHGDSGRLWLIGTATCETYLRCQVYHPSMEKDWDLQALPIAARSPLPGLFSRLGGNGILSSSAESLTPSMGFPPRQASEKADSIRRMNCCPMCMENYEQELAKLVTKESEKSSSDARPEAQQQQQSLPQWLQITKPNNGIKGTDQYQSKDQEQIWKQKAEELQKKWNDSCYRLHPGFHSHTNSDRSPALPNPTFDSRSTGNCYGSNPLLKQPFQPKLRLNRSNSTLQSTQNSTTKQLEQPVTPPASPVRTELILGRTKTSAETLQERLKDSTGCIPCEQQKPIQQFSDNFSSTHHFSDNTHQFSGKTSGLLDADSFKRLFKGLTERVGWQPEAASAVATTVMECRSGTGKRRGVGLKSDTWLLFLGLDKVGKRKMVMALSELVFANKPVWVRLGSQAGNQTGNCEEETSLHSRGKTVLDRIAEHVRRNPFSVIVLEDFDQADLLIHKSLKRAMEKGRLPDSHGREISLGSVIFALTANWLPEKFRKLPISFRFSEEKLEAAAASGWPLQLSVNTRVAANNKRRAEWLIEADDDQLQKPRKDLPVAAAAQPTLSIDLNLTAEDNEPVEVSHGSRDSSEITVEPGLKCFRSTDQLLRDVLDSVDNTVVFKPVDFNSLKQKIVDVIAGKFSGVIGDETALEIDEEALEQIMGGVWFGRGFESFEEWVDRVLVPGFRELKSSFPVTDVRMVSVKSAVTDCRAGGDLLPSKITVVTQ